MNNRKRQKIKHIRGAKLSKLQIWNLHQTLAAYIAGGLRQFMNREIYGFPSDLEKDAEVDPDGSIAMNEWRNILKEMLWSFDQIARNEYPPSMKWCLQQYKTLESQGISATDICLNPSILPDLPMNIYKADMRHSDRLQHGIDLFAKYFFDLWD